MPPLRDAVDRLTSAAQDAVDQLRALADQVRNSEQVGDAADRINTISDNIEAAVQDARDATAQDPGTGDQPVDPGGVEPPQ